MFTAEQITQNIINQLRLLDPTVSAEIGTPERKLIEATAEMIASSQIDFTVLNQQHDLDTLAGGRLDAYLSTFNFGRQAAVPSSGYVKFGRSVAGLNAIVIPQGTQVIANVNDPLVPTLTYVTTQNGVLESGDLEVLVPIICAVAGTVSNIDASKITGFGGLKNINGITIVTNPQPITGGLDQESDAAYKLRFQNTFLRNLAGTNDMYLALAVALNGISKANVVGPLSRYQEYIQVPADDDAAQETDSGYDDDGLIFPHKRTSEQSTIPYSKYTYPTNFYLTNGTLDPATAVFFRPQVDYVFNSPPIDADTPPTQADDTPVTSPNVTFLDPYDSVDNPSGNQALAEDTVVLFEHAYMSVNSRNDSGFGIFNCVDVFIDGQQAAAASSVEVIPGDAHDLQNTNTLLWTYQKLTAPKVINFRRALDGAACPLGNRIQPLFWQPVVDLPDSLLVGPAVYYKAKFWNDDDNTYYNRYDPATDTYSLKAHYALVYEVNSYYGTVRARSGIEWFMSGNNFIGGQLPEDSDLVFSGPTVDLLVGAEFEVSNYLYDQNVSDLQAILEKNKTVTQDVLAHKAKLRYFRPLVTIMYSLGATKSVVDTSIAAALSTFFTSQYFGAAIQLSDILQTIHNVPGVDNVRWTNEAGNKMEEVGSNGTTLDGGPFWITADFYLQDNELPASPLSNAVTITVRAANTWGS